VEVGEAGEAVWRAQGGDVLEDEGHAWEQVCGLDEPREQARLIELDVVEDLRARREA
jgi:hypothetical protein